MISIEVVRARVSEAAFGNPLVVNNLRSMVVEAMLSLVLPTGWTWCAADWAGWDFAHDDGTRLEVKQSAARQTWAAPARPSPAAFDIRERTGWWEGAAWTAGAGRHAHIYVFAHHPLTGDDADHRDPGQWVFHVVATGKLPSGKRMGLAALRRLSADVGYDAVVEAVEVLRAARVAESQLGSPPARG